MAKTAKTTRLGLSFGAEELFMAQTEVSARQFTVTSLADLTAKIPFSIDLISEDNGAEMVGSELRNALDSKNITTDELSLSLDLNFGIIIKIPYEKKFSNSELNNHLQWELQQYIDDDIDDYFFDAYKLIQTPSMKHPELVLVGARKKVVNFFNDVCTHAGLSIRLISMDLLAAVNTFEANYTFDPKEKIALVEIGERKLVFTILEGSFFVGHHYILLDDSVKENFNETIVQVLSMNLKTLFTDYELSKDKSNFDHVFIYRSNSTHSITQIIESAGEANYSILNPFEKIFIGEELQDQIDTSEENSEFVEAVGLTVQ